MRADQVARPMTATERSRKRRAAMTTAQRTFETGYFAAKRRAELVALLAPDGKCARCSKRSGALEIDHVDGRDYDVAKLSPSVRAARYWREYASGVRLRALCPHCNGTIGGGMRRLRN